MRRIELGAIQPQESGWETLDLREGATHVQSATDLSNFPNDTFDRINTTDMIEHIGWREVRGALREWLRVLKPGGELHIQTPNADEMYHLLLGRATETRQGDETEWEHFCRVAYGHQDYPENSHRSYFNPQWLKQLLYEAGAKKVWVIYEELTRFQVGVSK